MNLMNMWAKSQKWSIAGGIILVSTAMFTWWWITKDPQQSAKLNKDAPTRQPKRDTKISSSEADATKLETALPEVKIDPETMLVSGKDLLQIRETGISRVKENWLEHEISAKDKVIYDEACQRVIVTGSSSDIHIFEVNGQFAGNLKLESGMRFDGYVCDDVKTAIFFRDGNVWRGLADWKRGLVTEEKQVTNIGTFLGNPFVGRLKAGTDKGLLYRDHRYGLIYVNLETGETQTGQLPVNSTTGPEGRLVIGDTSERPPQLVVYDVHTESDDFFSMPSRILQNGLQWMGDQKAALILRNHIYLYDHQSKSLDLLFCTNSIRETIKPVSVPYQGQPYIFFQHSGEGIHMLNTETKKIHSIDDFVVHGLAMLKDGAFLLTSDVADSDKRGTWLGRFGEQNFERGYAQPLQIREMPIPIKLSNNEFYLVQSEISWFLFGDSENFLKSFESPNRFVTKIQRNGAVVGGEKK